MYCRGRRTNQGTCLHLPSIGCHGNAASTTVLWSCSRRELCYHGDEATCLLSAADRRNRQLIKTTTRSVTYSSEICEINNNKRTPEVYTLCVRKKQDTLLMSITSWDIDRFSKFFTARLCTKFATKWALYFLPYLKDDAALLREIIVFQKSHKFQNIVHVFTN